MYLSVFIIICLIFPPPTFYLSTPELHLNYTSVFIKQEFIASCTINEKLALRSLGSDLMKFKYTGINQKKVQFRLLSVHSVLRCQTHHTYSLCFVIMQTLNFTTYFKLYIFQKITSPLAFLKCQTVSQVALSLMEVYIFITLRMMRLNIVLTQDRINKAFYVGGRGLWYRAVGLDELTTLGREGRHKKDKHRADQVKLTFSTVYREGRSRISLQNLFISIIVGSITDWKGGRQAIRLMVPLINPILYFNKYGQSWGGESYYDLRRGRQPCRFTNLLKKPIIYIKKYEESSGFRGRGGCTLHTKDRIIKAFLKEGRGLQYRVCGQDEPNFLGREGRHRKENHGASQVTLYFSTIFEERRSNISFQNLFFNITMGSITDWKEGRQSSRLMAPLINPTKYSQPGGRVICFYWRGGRQPRRYTNPHTRRTMDLKYERTSGFGGRGGSTLHLCSLLTVKIIKYISDVRNIIRLINPNMSHVKHSSWRGGGQNNSFTYVSKK